MPDRQEPLCEDGSFEWDCIGKRHGHRLQCSSSHPKMCASQTCGGSKKNYCCEAKASDCPGGKLRPFEGVECCPPTKPRPCRPLNLVFLLDSSGSIGKKGFDQSRMFLKKLINVLPLGQRTE